MQVTVPRIQPSQARISINITHVADAIPETVAFLSDLVSAIAAAAINGAFRMAHLHGSQTYASWPLTLASVPAQTKFELELTAVDLRFVECLRSACEAQELSAQIESVAIDTVPPSGDVVMIAHPNGIEGRDIYPPLLRPRLNIDNQFDSSARMHQIIIEMDRPVQASDIDAVAEFIAPWGKLLEAGAFCLPRLDPALAYSIMGPTKMFEADSVEILIDRFEADLEGMNALLNMIDSFAVRMPRAHAATLY